MPENESDSDRTPLSRRNRLGRQQRFRESEMLAFTHVPPDVFAAEVDYLWMDAYIPKYLDSQVLRKYRGKNKERVSYVR